MEKILFVEILHTFSANHYIYYFCFVSEILPERWFVFLIMSFTFHLLEREHLEYELKIRGIVNIGSRVKNDVLAQNLSYLLELEKSGTDFQEHYDLESTEEIQAGIEILNKLARDINGILEVGLTGRIDVTLWHLRGRLGRIATDNVDQCDQIALLLDKLDTLEKSYIPKRNFILNCLQPKKKEDVSPSTSKNVASAPPFK